MVYCSRTFCQSQVHAKSTRQYVATAVVGQWVIRLCVGNHVTPCAQDTIRLFSAGHRDNSEPHNMAESLSVMLLAQGPAGSGGCAWQSPFLAVLWLCNKQASTLARSGVVQVGVVPSTVSKGQRKDWYLPTGWNFASTVGHHAAQKARFSRVCSDIYVARDPRKAAR